MRIRVKVPETSEFFASSLLNCSPNVEQLPSIMPAKTILKKTGRTFFVFIS
jgi:hypothetical protein